ncbi:MAG: lipopolysaccharide biosynthesis protein [Flavobacteriaceae bacterium]
MLELIRKIKVSIDTLINKGQKRSVRAKKHIIASFLIKGVSILIGFLMVPLTIGYVQKEQYGIWLTLSSVVAWFSFFDIGLGHGLRNKLAEALAQGKKDLAKTYVSTAYAILAAIFISILGIFFVVQPLLNWQVILNTTAVDASELRLVAIALFSFFCINFVLKLIYSIFLADQRPANQGFINLISNFIALLIIFVLTKTTQGSLFYLALTIGLAPMVILIAVSLFMFNRDYKEIAPSFRFIQVSEFKELIGLGFRFFIIQISSLIIFSTDNIIIAQILGPSEVPAYAVAHKYFGLITAVFSIISVPFWSAYTEAYVKKDLKWIYSTNRKLIRIWGALVIVSLFMLSISTYFYRFWVPEIEVPFLLSVIMCLYVNTLAWGNIFVVFVNGVGKIQLQLIAGVISTLINIPLSYYFAYKLGLGSAGVILASIVCIAYGPIVAPRKLKKILRGTATGIWNK